MCHGMYNEDYEQTSADICIPQLIGDCWNHCPVDCGTTHIVCPGMTRADGCKDPDFCASAEHGCP